MFIKKRLFAILLPGALLLSSCGVPKDIMYFQDIDAENVLEIDQERGVTAKPSDELSIIVTSKDPELAAVFNLPLVTTIAGRGNQNAYNQQVATYTVDNKGNIEFPLVGTVHVEGLSREEIADKIKHELVARSLISDPVLSINFVNHFFSVTGEVVKPGRFPFDRDQMTIIDALAQAGDLTIFGNRKNVKVIRVDAGKQHSYIIDLTNAEKMTKSPAYFIQQNDMIYVSPNAARSRQSTVNGNNLISYSFWLSLASVLTSMAVLIFK